MADDYFLLPPKGIVAEHATEHIDGCFPCPLGALRRQGNPVVPYDLLRLRSRTPPGKNLNGHRKRSDPGHRNGWHHSFPTLGIAATNEMGRAECRERGGREG